MIARAGWLGWVVLCSCLAAEPALGQSRGLDTRTQTVGELLLPVTNYGIVGAIDGDEPSARWPGPTGIDHLRMGALWLGARVWGIPRVSCSAYGAGFPMELQAGTSPWGDDNYVIYESAENYAHGDRYPSPDWDWDLDGLEDEDPRDGLDNDADGMIDEDGATISDQMLSCFYRDDLSECFVDSPYHQPLQLHVYQESYQWSTPLLADFVGLRFTAINTGPFTWEDFYFGWYADWRVLLDGLPGDEADDRIGYYSGPVDIGGGERIELSIAFAYEEAGGQASYAGIVLLDHPIDPAGLTAPETLGIRSFRFFVPDLSFEEGGEPTNDEQMYASMGAEIIPLPPDTAANYSTLISSGPFLVSPGDSLTWELALVAGASEADLLEHAAAAMLLYRGQAFDRDGDLETGPNGLEYVVHWWPHAILTQAPEGPSGLRLAQNYPNPFNPRTEIRIELPESAPVSLRIYDGTGRHLRTLIDDAPQSAGALRAIWNGLDDAGRPLPSGVYYFQVEAGEYKATRKMTLLR